MKVCVRNARATIKATTSWLVAAAGDVRSDLCIVCLTETNSKLKLHYTLSSSFFFSRQDPVKPGDFGSRYYRYQPEPANDPALGEEGFFSYRPKGMVWTHELTETDVMRSFPNGQFMGQWGSVVNVTTNDFLAMPFPGGGEVYCIPGALLSATYEPVKLKSKWSMRKVTPPSNAKRSVSVTITPEQLLAVQEQMGVAPVARKTGRRWPRYLMHPHRPYRLACTCELDACMPHPLSIHPCTR